MTVCERCKVLFKPSWVMYFSHVCIDCLIEQERLRLLDSFPRRKEYGLPQIVRGQRARAANKWAYGKEER